MYKIAVAKDLGTHMYLFEIEAPAIANKAQAGQFPNFSLKKAATSRLTATTYLLSKVHNIILTASSSVSQTARALECTKRMGWYGTL